MPQLGTMSLEIEGLLLLLLLLLFSTIHATATHLANKSCRRERGKKKWKPTHGRQSWRRLCPRWQSLHLEGNIFHTLHQLGVLSFRVSPPFKKKRKPVPQLVPHFAMFAQAGDKLLGVRFVTTKALFIIEPFGTHTHIEWGTLGKFV